MNFIETDFGISRNHQEIIDREILSNNFPWFYQDSSTSYKFPFFSHILVPRYDHTSEEMPVNSLCFDLFKDIFISFCDINGIKWEKILRASLNLSYYFPDPHSDPHIDHPFDHKVMIMYLNDVDDGHTLVYDQTFDGKNSNFDNVDSLTLVKKVKPKKGKICCFNGSNYHAAEWPAPSQRRVICVLTFI
jgi:hypothetical protein